MILFLPSTRICYSWPWPCSQICSNLKVNIVTTIKIIILDNIWMTIKKMTCICRKMKTILKNESIMVDSWSLGNKHNLLLSCFFQVPGLVHDSQVSVWHVIYDKVNVSYDGTGSKCTVNCAFREVNHNFLIHSSHDSLTAIDRTDEEWIKQI